MNMSIRCRASVIVLTLACLAGALAPGRAQMPAQDTGAAGAWQKLLKLRTTASAMHTTAHPDDEHGGVLAMLSRGQGARVSLLTLTRGESGDNAIGPELFDALGLIRTEELLVADRYYGVDRQYFGDGGRLRVLQAPRRGAGEVGQGPRPPRHRRRHPDRAAVRAHRDDSRATSATATATIRRPGWSRRKRSSWRATRRCFPSRSRRGSARGSR